MTGSSCLNCLHHDLLHKVKLNTVKPVLRGHGHDKTMVTF